MLITAAADTMLERSFFVFAEGLAVGVGFGAIGKSASATFENARYGI